MMIVVYVATSNLKDHVTTGKLALTNLKTKKKSIDGMNTGMALLTPVLFHMQVRRF